MIAFLLALLAIGGLAALAWFFAALAIGPNPRGRRP